MTTTDNNTLDFDISHLIEGGVAVFALGLTLGTLIGAGMTSAVVLGAVAAIATYLVRHK
ncbi:hypothetical protein AAEU29_11785 [Pseudoalteromonas sp. SSM20]|uniref:hypothetical protein n=1 Tax=Pseudoalteromonas sp. SSM20 TaxID=3139394 RepID=UPI003BAA175A